MEKYRIYAWPALTLIGVMFIAWGLHQVIYIPRHPAFQWDWLTADADVLEYIKFWFQIHGAWTLANGLFYTFIAATAFRTGDAWSRWALAYLPVHITLLTFRFFWLSIITIPLALIATLALCAGRQSDPVIPGAPARRGWVVFVPIGLVILYYAYDNLVVIPALDPTDPDRGWDWLTLEPAVIDYFKFNFVNLGLRVLSIGVLTLVTAWAGLRRGSRFAWWVLWIIPALLLAHVYFWPWLALPLIGLALLGAAGLVFSSPGLRETENA